MTITLSIHAIAAFLAGIFLPASHVVTWAWSRRAYAAKVARTGEAIARGVAETIEKINESNPPSPGDCPK